MKIAPESLLHQARIQQFWKWGPTLRLLFANFYPIYIWKKMRCRFDTFLQRCRTVLFPRLYRYIKIQEWLLKQSYVQRNIQLAILWKFQSSYGWRVNTVNRYIGKTIIVRKPIIRYYAFKTVLYLGQNINQSYLYFLFFFLVLRFLFYKIKHAPDLCKMEIIWNCML